MNRLSRLALFGLIGACSGRADGQATGGEVGAASDGESGKPTEPSTTAGAGAGASEPNSDDSGKSSQSSGTSGTSGTSTSGTSEAGASASSQASDTGAASTGTGGDPEDCSTNPIPWCDESTLPTPNGVPVEPPGVGGCLPGMARVEGFCIDRWEAALVALLPGDQLGPWSPYHGPGDAPMRAVSVPGAIPQGYISQLQAKAACEHAGKRLCTDAEWLRACQGASGTVYPFGDAPAPGTCNDARTCHPAIQYFETAADWIWSELDHPCLDQLPAGLAATGAHPGCISEDGILDMMGNLHEWTADPAGSFRGGFYVDTIVNGPGCKYLTTAHTVTYSDYSTGFRCCAD